MLTRSPATAKDPHRLKKATIEIRNIVIILIGKQLSHLADFEVNLKLKA